MRGSAVRTSLSSKSNLEITPFEVGCRQFAMQRIPSESAVSKSGLLSSQLSNGMLIPTNLLFTYVPARNREKSLHQAL